VESNDTEWAALASRAIRGLLVRKGTTVPRLAVEMRNVGADESARTLEGKMHRGTFRFSFFLQVVSALRADLAPQWRQAIESSGNWDDRAGRLLRSELAARPWLDWIEVSRRLASINQIWEPEDLSKTVVAGTFSTTLFLQCAVVCSFQGLDFFVDQSDLFELARRGSETLRSPPSSDFPAA
jgi:hypothetical protein